MVSTVIVIVFRADLSETLVCVPALELLCQGQLDTRALCTATEAERWARPTRSPASQTNGAEPAIGIQT